MIFSISLFSILKIPFFKRCFKSQSKNRTKSLGISGFSENNCFTKSLFSIITFLENYYLLAIHFIISNIIIINIFDNEVVIFNTVLYQIIASSSTIALKNSTKFSFLVFFPLLFKLRLLFR